MNRLSMIASALLLGLSGQVAAAGLVPPPGYAAGIEKQKSGAGDFKCEAVPTPFTGKLQFRSKYEGSDSSRSTFNASADKSFRDSTASITSLEKGVAQQVTRYLRDGRPQQLDCALGWLTTWARADALLSTDFNHTGKSMRKWALGSLSGAWLQLKFSNARPLAAHQAQAEEIEKWFGRLADQVVSDWSNLPLAKINNHSYWAAWSVMATAVVTDRRDLFDWAVKEYRVAANQVDADGFLPNELKRKQRALAYHNYALPPLAMIASFAQVNGVDLRGENNQALKRLGEQVLAGSKDPRAFERKTGDDQDMDDLRVKTKYVWLEPWCSLYACNADVQKRRQGMQPFNSFRLGGDVTRLYDPGAERR